jgi:vitamin B12 transporter
MHRQVIVAGAVALALTGIAGAQDMALEDEGVTVLDAMVVTAGREPVAAAKTARAHTVITAEELEARNVRTVAEALRQVPGLAVNDVGGQTTISIRGAEANHVLVLIDGFETAGSAQGFEFAHHRADQVERIEVLRGPQSALWGAGATSGVINIITKRGAREGHRVETFAEGGSNGSYAGGATLRGGTGNADFSLGVAYRDEAGWDPRFRETLEYFSPSRHMNGVDAPVFILERPLENRLMMRNPVAQQSQLVKRLVRSLSREPGPPAPSPFRRRKP